MTVFISSLANWPESFAEYVEAYFASRIVLKVTGDADKTKLVYGVMQKALDFAKNRAAMAFPTSFPARGSWVKARTSGSSRERGNNGNPLIG